MIFFYLIFDVLFVFWYIFIYKFLVIIMWGFESSIVLLRGCKLDDVFVLKFILFLRF